MQKVVSTGDNKSKSSLPPSSSSTSSFVQIGIFTNFANDCAVQVKTILTLKELIDEIASALKCKAEQLTRCSLGAAAYGRAPYSIDMEISMKKTLAELGLAQGYSLIFRFPFIYARPEKKEEKKEEDSKQSGSGGSDDKYKGLTVSNCVKKLNAASSAKEIARIAEYIGMQATDLKESGDLLKLKEAQMIAFVKSDVMALPEIDLFELVVEWGTRQLKLQKDKKDLTLKTVVKNVIPHVRIPLINMSDFAGKVSSVGILEQQQLLDMFSYLGLVAAAERANKKLPALPSSLRSFSIKPRSLGASLFEWSETNKSTPLTISNKGLTITNSSSSSSWYGARATKPLSRTGKSAFSVKIVKKPTCSNTWALVIGVALADYKGSPNLGGSSHQNGWAYIANGAKCHHGEGSYSGATYGEGDIITVELNNTDHTLTFYKNGISQGLAYSSMPTEELYPAMSCTPTGCQLTFCAPKTSA
eukprot:TRINITY_DN72_c0_g1_i5.p1 TRINITY_DN72_c0_g1~~TRINITY_DN72_c0_g1_i5.p1  ORF type:complete len:473 (-),score=147.36 TRINITY_DN72_c0_g1_i5:309-1727(-)